METLITKPKDIPQKLFAELIELVESGAQADSEGLADRLMNADLIALKVDNDKIVTTATLKNPANSYRNRVFRSAGVERDQEPYTKELGYIVTDPLHEGKKHCQHLLNEFMPYIKEHKIFATTRKPSMIHILSKYGFRRHGNIYKDDLNLLVYNGKE